MMLESLKLKSKSFNLPLAVLISKQMIITCSEKCNQTSFQHIECWSDEVVTWLFIRIAHSSAGLELFETSRLKTETSAHNTQTKTWESGLKTKTCLKT